MQNTRFVSLLIALGLGLTQACGGPAETSEPDNADTTGDEAVVEPFTVETGSLAAAIAGPQRSESNRARDAFRHPAETLAFFGLEPTMSIIEMAPGGGWYTEILAPTMRDHGQLTLAMADPASSQYSARLVARLAEHPEVYDQAQHQIFALPASVSLGEPGSADMVLTFRSTHGWVNGGGAEQIYAAMFEVLRPGGVLGVVQHRADEDAEVSETSPRGYVPEAHVIALAEAAGFVLEERSDINANPNDDHDHPEGVWTLPPSLRLGEVDREQWVAIGESDRMTLRFRKPAAEEPAAAE